MSTQRPPVPDVETAVRGPVDDRDQPPRAAAPYAANPVGLVLVLLGCVAIVVSLFLPYYDDANVDGGNSAIQQDKVMLILVLWACLLALTTYRASLGRRPRLWSFLWPVLVAVSAGFALDGDTLYPVIDGEADTTQDGYHVSAGIASYVMAAGAGLSLLGLIMLRGWIAGDVTSARRACPECAETIKAEAKVCRYCGHRLPPETQPESPLERQSVPPSTWGCTLCGATFADHDASLHHSETAHADLGVDEARQRLVRITRDADDPQQT